MKFHVYKISDKFFEKPFFQFSNQNIVVTLILELRWHKEAFAIENCNTGQENNW